MPINSIILSSPGPIAFYIGSWPVRWYGVIIALGFLVSYFIFENLFERKKLNKNHLDPLVFLLIIFSIVFARLYFVVFNFEYFKNNPIEIPQIWLGGQSIHGGLIGAVLAVFIFCKIKKTSFYSYIDLISVVTPLAQSIGRWGNFFNNEAFGLPLKTGFIKLFIPNEYRPEKYINNNFFHPTFLYESLLDLILFFFLLKKYQMWSNKPGKIFWSYLFLYSIIRFPLEFLRLDSLYVLNAFPVAQVTSIIIFILSGVFLMMINKQRTI